MTNSKKRTRRSRTKYPALKRELNLKSRYDLIDYDYLHKLTDEEKEWLNKFTEEYTCAKLNFRDLSKNLHNTKKLKKDCTDRNNARNADIYTKTKAYGNLNFFGEPSEEDIGSDESWEDRIIEQLDRKEE